jgi:uncharacterized repeat protein (TIGR01451 family)
MRSPNLRRGTGGIWVPAARRLPGSLPLIPILLLTHVLGCSHAPVVDRAKLPIVRRFDNIAVAEYQSVWSDVRFTARSAKVVVALVNPEGTASVEADAGSVTARPEARFATTQPARPTASATQISGVSTSERDIGSQIAVQDKGRGTVLDAASSSAATQAIGSATTRNSASSSNTQIAGGSARLLTAKSAATQTAVRGEAFASNHVGSAQAGAERGHMVAVTTRGSSIATAATGDVALFSDIGDTTVTALRPELSLEKSADHTHVLPGDPISYQITIKNTGPLVVEAVELLDSLPADLEFVSASGAKRVDAPAHSRECRFRITDRIPIGSTIIVTILTRVVQPGKP